MSEPHGLEDGPGPGPDPVATRERKDQHLDLFGPGGPRPSHPGTTWLEHVHLIHQALPDLALDQVDTSVELCGRRLAAPLMISAMTGGTPRAREINRALARVAQSLGIAMGLGSQRAMLEDPRLTPTYLVRDLAPDVVLAGNVGAWQLLDYSPAQVAEALDEVGADLVMVHLNPAQELAQLEGDRDFTRGARGIRALVEHLGKPVMVKEVGSGISRETGANLAGLGVYGVDVAGAGGTSWVAAELMRSGREGDQALAPLHGWGIPTAASLLEVSGLGLPVVIASGGISSGLDMARAIALGATLCAVAAPALRILVGEGEETLTAHLGAWIRTLRAVMLLTGSRDLEALRSAPRVILGPLAQWAAQRGSTPHDGL